jgi:hypothetical protein
MVIDMILKDLKTMKTREKFNCFIFDRIFTFLSKLIKKNRKSQNTTHYFYGLVTVNQITDWLVFFLFLIETLKIYVPYITI